jgi:hypothetical protein
VNAWREALGGRALPTTASEELLDGYLDAEEDFLQIRGGVRHIVYENSLGMVKRPDLEAGCQQTVKHESPGR